MNLRLALVSGILLTASSAFGSIVFDLESTAATGVSSGALTSVSQTVGGLTLTIDRESGGHFDIADLSGFTQTPAGWGGRTLSPFFDALSATAFIGNFSAAVNSVSVEMGDFVASDADDLLLQAFSGADGTGTFLGSISLAGCCTNANPSGFEAHTLSVIAPGIQSIRFIGGPAGGHSIYYDNFTVDLADAGVPEPGTVGLIGLGIALGAARLRKLKK